MAAETRLSLETPSLTPSEERRRTGQYVVVGVIIATSLIGLYHACVQQNAMLAGFIAPALIMLLYLLWVLHTARRTKLKEVQKLARQRQPHQHHHHHHNHQHRHNRRQIPTDITVPQDEELAAVHKAKNLRP
ncbi:uncharacterized protein [Anabrus simplex]|uniref:uncharacterized protein n=1 Tax=Anabrus simplex TaxID=316456 RepID=UPI0034DCED09